MPIPLEVETALRSRRRARVLRKAVLVLACAALAVVVLRTTAPKEGPRQVRAPKQRARQPHALAKSQTTKASVSLQAAQCSSVLTYSLPYPLVCALGEVFAIAYLGGSPLTDHVWDQIDKAVAIVITRQNPRITISPSIGRLTDLLWLFLEESIHGPIPTTIALLTELRVLSVWSGADFVPTQVGLLSKLERLELGFHNWGPLQRLPSQLGGLGLLSVLRVPSSNFRGTIPTQLGLLSNVERLELDSNFLNGSLPSQLFALGHLKELIVHNNKELSGPLPSQLALLTGAEHLSLSDNRFEGSLPSQLGRVTSLRFLRVARNRLTGTLPVELSQSSLDVLDVSGNDMEGTIPTQYGLLLGLREMWLGDNRFGGTLPSELGLLHFLREVSARSNGLAGTLPSELALLSSLVRFDLDGNRNVMGPVPPLPTGVVLGCIHTRLEHSLCPSPSPSPPPVFLSGGARWSVYSLGGIVGAGIVVMCVLVVTFRKQPVIRSTNPAFSVLTLVGLLLLVAALYPYGIAMGQGSDSTRERGCVAALHLGTQGVALVLCCITARNYPIWRIFVKNNSMRIVHVSLASLAGPVLACSAFVLGLAVLIGLGIEANGSAHGCVMRRFQWAAFALLGFLGVLVLVGTWMSYQIRTVPSKFNDTQNIAKAMYLFLTFGTAMVCVSLLSDDPDVRFLGVSFCVVLTTLTFVLVVHAPKVFRLYEPDDARRMSLKAPKPSAPANRKAASPAIAVL